LANTFLFILQGSALADLRYGVLQPRQIAFVLYGPPP